ncbi:MAG: hypothetical protein C0505_10170 [Leptothrix sp. (in: Bacteria)]|nr:hypothetical protein [Leptothrix sp. (in: b-proteobacteria)]
MRACKLILAGLLSLSVSTAWAGAPAAAVAASAPPPGGTGAAAPAPALESAREGVRAAAEWLASGVDSWFGDKPFKDGGKVSDGRLSLSVLKRQDTGNDVNLRFNARFRLPNAEKHTYLFIGRDSRSDVVSDQPAALSKLDRLLREGTGDQTFFAGIGRTLTEALDFRLGLRGGLKPYLQARYQRPWAPGPDDDIEFRQTFFWSLSDRLGSTTALSYEHAFSPTWVGRWLNAATITQKDSRFAWQSTVGLYKSLGDHRLVTLEGLVLGKEGSGVASTDFGLQVKWAQPVYKDWLVMELVAGHFRPRPDAQTARGRAWALGAGLRLRF